ncbi:MAG: Flp pilus assembly complex ATPase component TadA [Patescibacteria group bacterium]|nr:GspE/PulE family protein [Patescibacteria group bacterium]MDE1945764.1 Flp pilus assembly complex ATPase component TadA [Patescibacteria group bacterium]
MVTFDDSKDEKRLEELRKNEEEDVVRILSGRYGYPYLDLGPVHVNSDALRLVNETEARAAAIAIFDMVGKKLDIAIQSPNNDKTAGIIDRLSGEGYIPSVFLVSKRSLEKAWERYKDLSYSAESVAGTFDISSDQVVLLMDKISHIKDVATLMNDLLGVKQAYRISKIMEIMTAGALALGASDIHIEPEERDVRMRLRIDGVLLDTFRFDTPTYALLLSRIKLLSGLKLNVKDEAQDGRFEIKVKGSEIEIRTSVLPGAYGESVVMRVLNPKAISVPLEELGIEPRTLDILMDEIRRPNGMLLITGPTGSGKTTTLYAFMKKIYTPDVKIITIEDPVEYHLAGIVQTQVEEQKGYTFLAGLRAAMRQDPDVIMVGEIRDDETAGTAIQAALTGHLVFSTLHTNSAAGAFPRLVDLKVNPKTIPSALNVAMAQRLLRKLCQYCKKEKAVDAKEKKIIDDTLAGITDKTYLAGVQTEKVWVAVGCDKCNGTGYKGRTAIVEAILSTKAMEKVIMENASDRDIKEAAKSQNILDMRQDGVLKILRGVSSLEELGSVIDLEERL